MKKSTNIYTILILLAVFTGCTSLVPATTPLQLEHTPGPPIIITDNQIDAGWFQIDYPENWRVVTNIASEPLALVIVSPDEQTIIRVNTVIDRGETANLPTDDIPASYIDQNAPCPPQESQPCARDLILIAESEILSNTDLDIILEQMMNSLRFP